MDSINQKTADMNITDSSAAQARSAPSTEVNSSTAPAMTTPTLTMVDRELPPQAPGKINFQLLDARGSFAGNNAANAGGSGTHSGFVDDTGALQVHSNYLPLTLARPVGGKLFIYEVLGIQDSMTKPKKKVLMQSFIHKCAILHNQQQSFVTDNQKRIVAWRDLSIWDQKGRPTSDGSLAKIDVVNHDARQPNGAPQNLSLTLRELRDVSFDDLNAFCSGQNASWQDSDLVAAINLLISKQVVKPSTFTFGSSKVFAKAGHISLRHNKLAIRGYRFGFVPGMGRPLLNVNTTMSAFHEPMTVARYIQGKAYLQNDLRGVRVYLTLDRMKDFPDDQPGALDDPSRRFKTIQGFGKRAEYQFAYKNAEGAWTVWNHHEWWYKRQSEQTKGGPNSVSVNLGSENKPQWFLAEDLAILPHQMFRDHAGSLNADMVRHACRAPNANKAQIVGEFLSFLNINNQQKTALDVRDQGITVSSELVTLPARKITAPSPLFARNVTTQVTNGTWRLSNQQFLSSITGFSKPFFLAPTSLLEIRPPNLQRYLRMFCEEATRTGIKGLQFSLANTLDIASLTQDWLQKRMEIAAQNNADLLVLVLPAKNKVHAPDYANFKMIADQMLGIKSVCICEQAIINAFKAPVVQVQKVQSGQNAPMGPKVFQGVPDKIDQRHAFAGYARNVAMKLNVRLGNRNHTVPSSLLEKCIPDFKDDQKVMIMGADVVHPGAKAIAGTPSIAAVVGSIGSDFAAYRGSARYQAPGEEIIAGMEAMAYDRIDAYLKTNSELPTRIIFYRDGIDNGRFDRVLTDEVSLIKSAYKKHASQSDAPAPKLKITTIIVTKRHGTRFYPVNNTTKEAIPNNGNCIPGTVVDSGVTMPYNFDFFLISHNAIKGTARPAHYTVLKDEIEFSAAQIQDLTNLLCSTYARSTTAVSYATPAYYADHLCERTKQYLRPLYDGVELEEGEEVEDVVKEMWGRGGRPEGDPWNEKLDDTMFWL